MAHDPENTRLRMAKMAALRTHAFVRTRGLCGQRDQAYGGSRALGFPQEIRMNPRNGRLMLLLWLALAGCDDGRVAERQVGCRDYCAKLELCDDRTDLAGCERRCAEERIRSDEYMTARAQCANDSSCNTWAGEVGLMGEDVCSGSESCQLDDCTADELARIALTNGQQSYCEQVVSKLNACDRTASVSALTSHCEEQVPALSQTYLQQIKGCIELECGQVKTCLDTVGDQFNTDISLYPPTTGENGTTGRRSDAGRGSAQDAGADGGQGDAAGTAPQTAIGDAAVTVQ